MGKKRIIGIICLTVIIILIGLICYRIFFDYEVDSFNATIEDFIGDDKKDVLLVSFHPNQRLHAGRYTFSIGSAKILNANGKRIKVKDLKVGDNICIYMKTGGVVETTAPARLDDIVKVQIIE